MRCFLKFFKLTVIVAVIGLSMLSCDLIFNPGTNDNGTGGSGNSGGSGINPTITIKNNTGYTINGIYIKESTATDWGSELIGWSSNLSNGASRGFTLSKSLSANNVYDFRLQSSTGSYSFRKYMVTVSNNMTVTFSTNDLNDGGNLPSITIQNRSGVSFNSVYIKPSASSDWGTSFGLISNNSNSSYSIPIPPSSFTIFDIQARSINPTNTYTRNNITISNGMILTYTSADSDSSLIGSLIIVMQNNTGYTINGIYIKESTATDWGSELIGWSSDLSNGASRTFPLSKSLSDNNVYDFRLQSSTGSYSFRKYMVTVSNGMIITFTTNDLNDGSNLPTITVQNRSGVAFNSIFIKPSVSSDWGTSFGSLSNNSNGSVTIPIPPSSYTTFDIQARSTNPANTYTKNDVTISNGNVLTLTSADSDNTLLANPVIVLQNNTGYSISGVWIKASSSASWGSSLSSSISDGASRAYTLSQSLSANNVYDIRLRQTSSSGNTFTKYEVIVSEGMILTFTTSDLE